MTVEVFSVMDFNEAAERRDLVSSTKLTVPERRTIMIIIKGVTHQVALSSAVPPGSQATIADMTATTSKINEKGEVNALKSL